MQGGLTKRQSSHVASSCNGHCDVTALVRNLLVLLVLRRRGERIDGTPLRAALRKLSDFRVQHHKRVTGVRPNQLSNQMIIMPLQQSLFI